MHIFATCDMIPSMELNVIKIDHFSSVSVSSLGGRLRHFLFGATLVSCRDIISARVRGSLFEGFEGFSTSTQLETHKLLA